MLFKKLNLKRKGEIHSILEDKAKGGYICCINANTIVFSNNNDQFLNLINGSLGNICDGFWVSKILRKFGYDVEYYSGPDLFINTLKSNKYKNIFLGSNSKNLCELENNLIKLKVLKDDVVKIELPYLPLEEFNLDELIEKIFKHKVDIIWLSLGAPKQEMFSKLFWNKIKQNPSLNKVKIICVGAAFDFYSPISKVQRAPLLFRKIGLEWLWRLLKQPKKTFNRLSKELTGIPKIIINELIKTK
jgi:N-acetylglucosaminyldiphosphoundecaprenol N-acetyl-beta-D-mannosaminyltransferase